MSRITRPSPRRLIALMAVPAVSQTDITFGTRLDHGPSSRFRPQLQQDGSDDPTPRARVAIDRSIAPRVACGRQSGTVVAFRARQRPGVVTFRLAH